MTRRSTLLAAAMLAPCAGALGTEVPSGDPSCRPWREGCVVTYVPPGTWAPLAARFPRTEIARPTDTAGLRLVRVAFDPVDPVDPGIEPADCAGFDRLFADYRRGGRTVRFEADYTGPECASVPGRPIARPLIRRGVRGEVFREGGVVILSWDAGDGAVYALFGPGAPPALLLRMARSVKPVAR